MGKDCKHGWKDSQRSEYRPSIYFLLLIFLIHFCNLFKITQLLNSMYPIGLNCDVSVQGHRNVESNEVKSDDDGHCRRVKKTPHPENLQTTSETTQAYDAVNSDSGVRKRNKPQAKTADRTLMISKANSSKPDDKTSLPDANNSESQSQASQWTQGHQKLLENALIQFPKDLADRWEKISELIPGKSKVCAPGPKFLNLTINLRWTWAEFSTEKFDWSSSKCLRIWPWKISFLMQDVCMNKKIYIPDSHESMQSLVNQFVLDSLFEMIWNWLQIFLDILCVFWILHFKYYLCPTWPY